MKRRDWLAGLALAGFGTAAGQQEQESLYIPQPHRVEDRKLLHDFMDEFSFVELVTASPEIRITHIPVLLERTAGHYGTLYGHIATGLYPRLNLTQKPLKGLGVGAWGRIVSGSGPLASSPKHPRTNLQWSRAWLFLILIPSVRWPARAT